MFRSVWWLAVISLALLACAPIKVSTEAGRAADLAGYHTYRQVESSENASTQGRDLAEVASPAASLVEAEIAAQLRAKGYRRGSETASDLMVSFRIDTNQEIRLVNASDPDTDYRVPKRVSDDTLIISIFDAATESLVWRGTGQVETMLGGAIISESRERSLVRATRKVLAEFPSRPESDG